MNADKTLEREIIALGFEKVHRPRGKHQIWRHPNGTQLSTPRTISSGKRAAQNALGEARRLAKQPPKGDAV